jgi:hypothetical protein
MVVAVHLGLRWPLLMAVSRSVFGIAGTNALRTVVLRTIAIGISAQGLCSMLALNVHDRLLFRISLDWWNFEESVVAFFGHCLAIAGLWACTTHYAMRWQSHWMRRAAH